MGGSVIETVSTIKAKHEFLNRTLNKVALFAI